MTVVVVVAVMGLTIGVVVAVAGWMTVMVDGRTTTAMVDGKSPGQLLFLPDLVNLMQPRRM